MSPQRITKKEMKQDKFVTYSLKVSEWIQKHLNEVLMGVGAVILVGAIVFFILSSQAKKERNATRLLGKASIELQAGNIEEAVANLQTVVNDYGGTKSAGRASFFLATAHYYVGDYDQAQSMFEKYLKEYKGDIMFSTSAQAGIADCHMQRGNYILAAEEFVKAASLNPDGFLAPQYLLRAALAYLKADQKGKAREVLDKLIKEYPDSREMHQAKEQLAENLG
jgi:outer membrane protein assembly factor BamD (BamD/ComL family)